MKAVIIEQGKFKTTELPIPKLTGGKVLVRVKAFAFNRADILQMQGLYGSGGIIPGLELSGIRVDNGQEVCALVSGSGFAEYVLLDELEVINKPTNFSLIEAAGFLESLATAYLNIFIKAKVRAGQTILIHGGSSGVGTLAALMCKLRGLTVIATSSSDSKLEHCKALGADHALNYESNYDEVFKGQVDIVLDILGGDYFQKNIRCLKASGHLALIGVMAGSVSNISAASILMKNLTITGQTLRSKSIRQKRKIIDRALENFKFEMDSGKLKPVVDSVHQFENFYDAAERLISRQNFGKVIAVF